MKKNMILFLSTGIIIISSCRHQEKNSQYVYTPVAPKKNTITTVTKTTLEVESKNKIAETETIEAKNVKNQVIIKIKVSKPQAELITKIKQQDPEAKIDFAPFDTQALFLDTTFKGIDIPLELQVKTTSLNDSLVAQEMLLVDVRTTNKKSYLISHNYQSEIQLKKTGELIAKHLITKEFFKDYIQNEFLEKAILKHPESAEMNPMSNTIQLQFLIGVPATDWIVLATVGLKDNGEMKILKVENIGL